MNISITDGEDARRHSADYRISEKLQRVLWHFVKPLFFLSPRLLYGWRNFLLRLFGAKIGRRVQIYPSVRIFAPWGLEVGHQTTIGDRAHIYNVGRIQVGDRVTISQNAHLCSGSHDYVRPDMKLLRQPINIGENVWICADAFIGPGVTVKKNAIVGARSAVFHCVEKDAIVGGNPARFLKSRLAHPQLPIEERNAA